MSKLTDTNSPAARAMATLLQALAEQCCSLYFEGDGGSPMKAFCHFDRSKAERLMLAYFEKLENPAIMKSIEILTATMPAEDCAKQALAVLRAAQTEL